jgi:hypothetical protein
VTAPLKPGDVLHYVPSQHHCREGTAFVLDDGRVVDTFWHSYRCDGDAHYLTSAELATAGVRFNVNDYEPLDPHSPHASRGEWETYHPDDRGYITSQQGLQQELFIRRDAKPDLGTRISNAQAEVEKVEAEVRSAQRQLEWRREDLAKLLAQRAAVIA